ncbi:MAG TPA: hypothetical protein VG650_14785 [Mycobacteriales bacterium]|nr:hypothetical protein [Mycobacteriales bacterium]
MQTGDPLDASSVAAAIAPVIDRLRMAVVRAIRPAQAEIAERTGVPEAVLGPIGNLRNLMPDRSAAVDDVLALFVYQPAERIRAALDGLRAAGMLEGGDDVRLGGPGQLVVSELFARTQTFLDEAWWEHADLIASLLPIAQRACAAVAETGGAATRVVAPPYEPPGASPALLLAETLSPLRFHRHDAHTWAWQAEGLTAEQIQQLEPGPQRQRIEAETNRRAAAPYAVLTGAERFRLCTGLGALPN